MYYHNMFVPLNQFIPYLCFIMIFYLNRRKDGWGMKHNLLLSFAVAIFSIVMMADTPKQILDYHYWLTFLPILTSLYIIISPAGKRIRSWVNTKEHRTVKWGLIALVCVIIILGFRLDSTLVPGFFGVFIIWLIVYHIVNEIMSRR